MGDASAMRLSSTYGLSEVGLRFGVKRGKKEKLDPSSDKPTAEQQAALTENQNYWQGAFSECAPQLTPPQSPSLPASPDVLPEESTDANLRRMLEASGD